jgi:hypothetical protein
MKNEPLHHSENLVKLFAPYRDEAPLISTPEIEKLLADSATLNNHPPTPSFFRRGSLFNIRRIFMTLSGIAGLAAISYFAFFSTPSSNIKGTQGTNTTQGPYLTHPSHTTELSQLATPASIPAKHTSQLRKMGNPHGPWSAGNDQFYADLSREELAKLGIVVHGDSILTYKLNDKDSVTWSQFSEYSVPGIKIKGHSIGGGGILASAPPGVEAHRFYPILMTYSNGNGAAYRIEDGNNSECGMIGPEDLNKAFRVWLEKPGTPGLAALGFTSSSSMMTPCKNCPPIESDTIKIMVGKDLAPSPFPLIAPNIDSLSGNLQDALLQLAHYYEGSNVKQPSVTWPKNLSIKVDTFTARNLLDQMDEEENSGTMQHLRSIMARLNELVPVIVRPKGGSGAPDSNDYIFWYEPSEELFNALPTSQASIIRTKLNAPPHCISMPNEVLKIAEITYCVAEPQEVQVMVRDLTGKQLIGMSQLATAGDNVLQFSTETLPSGMYIVTVQDHDRTERSQRLWVENGHPKSYKDVNWKSNSPHAPDQMWFINTDEPTAASNEITPAEHTNEPTSANNEMTPAEHMVSLSIPSLTLDSAALSGIGVQSNSVLAAYYTQGSQPNAVNYMGVVRSWGAVIKTLSKSSVTDVNVPSFGPSIVTDGIGRKRIFAGDSNYSELVPILLRAGTPSDTIGVTDLIFWYQPTPEFLSDLSDSARGIAQRLSGVNGTTNTTDVHGAIQQAIAFPNPSKGQFAVKLTMSGARTLTFTLRNLLGQQAAPSVQARMVGTGEQALDFSTVAEGVYLLDISSDQGERYIERVVIAH